MLAQTITASKGNKSDKGTLTANKSCNQIVIRSATHLYLKVNSSYQTTQQQLIAPPLAILMYNAISIWHTAADCEDVPLMTAYIHNCLHKCCEAHEKLLECHYVTLYSTYVHMYICL